MKKPILYVLTLTVIGCLIVLAAFAQERPRTPGNPIYCSWLSVQPEFGPRGDITKFVVGAEFSQLDLKISGESEVLSVAKIQFDLLKGSEEDRNLATMIEQRALLEYRTTFPPPLDDRRRAIRSP